MKYLIVLLLLISLGASGQSYNDYVVAIQSQITPVNTPYHTHSALIGIKADDNDQFLIGPTYKRLMVGVGHKREYIGIKAHANAEFGRITPFISYEMMWGEFYMYNSLSATVPVITNTGQGTALLGIGYALNEDLTLFAGGSIQDYHPLRYHSNGGSPYKHGSIAFKLNYTFKLGVGMWSKGGQKRMW